MQGKNHVKANTAILLASLSFSSSIPFITERMIPPDPGIVSSVVYPLVGYSCFVLGSLLPDIDHKYSTLGKYFYLPVRHRTWTHSIWFVLPFLWLGTKNRFMFWMALGIILHILLDSFSASGVSFFYPFTSMRTYRRAKAYRGHGLTLYSVGDPAEDIFMLLVVVISLGFFVYMGLWNHGFWTFWGF